MNGAVLAAASKHIDLLDSLLPALDTKAAVAFGLSAFSRPHSVLRAVTTNCQERVWLDRLTDLERGWWQWCCGESASFPIVSLDAQRVVDAMQRLDLPDPLRLTVHTTCLALFEAFERGDYTHARHTALDNCTIIDLLDDFVAQATLDQLNLDELARQEQELLVLVEGVDSRTRDRLSAIASPCELVGEYLTLIPVPTLPDSW